MDHPSATAPPPERIAVSYRRAFLLGVVNGAMWQFGISFIEPSTVLPAFVNELTRSRLAVGVVAAISGAGWLLPQLVVAHYAQAMPRKLPVYRAAAAVRMASLGAVIAALHTLAGQPSLLLPLFLLFYAMFTFAGGAGAISFIDVVAKTIPPYRIGSFFGQRQIFGGILAVAAAAVVRQVLREGGPLAFPDNYTCLFLLGAVAIGIGVICFALIDEPPGPAQERRASLGEFLRQAPTVLAHDLDFRRLFALRMVQGLGGIAVPFYVVFAAAVLGMPRSMLGLYLGAQTLGSIVSNFLWAPMSDRYGGKRTLLLAAATGTAVPTLAAALALLPLPPDMAGWGFCSVFLLLGSASAASVIAHNHYLLEVAPELARPTYAGVLNTFSGVITLVPILGGVLVDALSYQAVFIIAAAAAFGALVLAGRLRDLRDDAADRFGQRKRPAPGAAGARAQAGETPGSREI